MLYHNERTAIKSSKNSRRGILFFTIFFFCPAVGTYNTPSPCVGDLHRWLLSATGTSERIPFWRKRCEYCCLIAYRLTSGVRAHLSSSKLIINGNSPFSWFSVSVPLSLASLFHRGRISFRLAEVCFLFSYFFFLWIYIFLWFSHKWPSKSLSIIYIPSLSKLLVFIKLSKQSNKRWEKDGERERKREIERKVGGERRYRFEWNEEQSIF